MALKHFVTPFRTGNSNLRRPDAADVAKRNEEYQRRKKAIALENFYDDTRDATYAENERKDFHRRANLVPFVVRNLVNEAYTIFPEIIFREYFTRLVTESLRPTPDECGKPKGIWDKELVEECTNGIRYMCHSYIKSLGGLQYLKETAQATGSEYLRKVYDMCMESGKKVASKKKVKLEKETNPANVEETKLDLSIDTEDEEMIDKNISSMNVEDISELVKDKVLEVVKDEELSHEKDQAFQTALKEEIKAAKAKQEIPEELPRTINNGDADTASDSGTAAADSGATATKDEANGGDAKPDKSDKEDESTDADDKSTDKSADKEVKENAQRFGVMQKWAMNGRIELQSSLLKSLTMRCYQSAVKEGAGAIAGAAAIRNQTNAERRIIPSAALNIYDSFLTGENEDLSYIDFARNSARSAIASTSTTNIDSEEVLEQAFAEALGMFTALECAYSIKLITPTETDIKHAIMYNASKND